MKKHRFSLLNAMLFMMALLSLCFTSSSVKADISLTDTQLGAQVLPPGQYGPPVPNRDRFHYAVTSPEQAFSIYLRKWNAGYMPTSNTDTTNGMLEIQLYAQTGGGTGDVNQNGHDWVYVGGIYQTYFRTDNVPTGTQCWYCGRLIGVVPGPGTYPDTYSGALFYTTPF